MKGRYYWFEEEEYDEYGITPTENNSLACRCLPGRQPNRCPRAVQTSETTPCVFLRSAGKARYASYPPTTCVYLGCSEYRVKCVVSSRWRVGIKLLGVVNLLSIALVVHARTVGCNGVVAIDAQGGRLSRRFHSAANRSLGCQWGRVANFAKDAQLSENATQPLREMGQSPASRDELQLVIQAIAASNVTNEK